MNKFLFKLSFFVGPFFLLYFINLSFYTPYEGDLVRLGYMYNDPSPKSLVMSKFSLPQKYTLLSEIDMNKDTAFTVLTIGDSFSEQDSLGYKNYLANENNISVLHVDRYISRRNPIQTLVNLINGNVFDSIHIDYVVLQSVERKFVERCENIDFNTALKKDSLINVISNHKTRKYKTDKQKLNFFSEATIKYPLINMLYYFTPKPIFSKTYKVKSTYRKLFTNKPKYILFYKDDIIKLKINNNIQKINVSNQVINEINNKLLKKNIRLILIISPDKYDVYYPFIAKSYKLEEPLFFKYFNKLNKKYLYTSLKNVFYKNGKPIKDVYYYDDTHWSPIGAKITACEIINLMNKK